MLFIYECFRLFLLLILVFATISETFIDNAFFPYAVFISPNTMFLLMALFLWLRPEVYSKYLSLYMAGKAISVILFLVWEFGSTRNFALSENIIISLYLFIGVVLINLADILSIWGAWVIKARIRLYNEADGGK